jgi:mRNA interferase RelE/StbE
VSVFNIEYSSEAFSQLKDLDRAVAERITKKIASTLENPKLFFKSLSGRPEYKLRVGDYRLIADIDEQKKVIFIRSLGHRKNIYKK